MNKISIIIPVLNERHSLESTLPKLQVYRQTGHELIVVDGGSVDGSVSIALGYADVVLETAAGRSVQMNSGAEHATGELFLFLHVDTLLPNNADKSIIQALQKTDRYWGRFDVRLSGAHPVYRMIGGLMNLRSRLSGVATGDQAIFVRASTFKAVGSYPDISLMEDIALSKALRKHGKPICLRQQVFVSSRRWEKHGVVRTVLLMSWLRLLFFLGVNPVYLHRLYYGK